MQIGSSKLMLTEGCTKVMCCVLLVFGTLLGCLWFIEEVRLFGEPANRQQQENLLLGELFLLKGRQTLPITGFTR